MPLVIYFNHILHNVKPPTIWEDIALINFLCLASYVPSIFWQFVIGHICVFCDIHVYSFVSLVIAWQIGRIFGFNSQSSTIEQFLDFLYFIPLSEIVSPHTSTSWRNTWTSIAWERKIYPDGCNSVRYIGSKIVWWKPKRHALDPYILQWHLVVLQFTHWVIVLCLKESLVAQLLRLSSENQVMHSTVASNCGAYSEIWIQVHWQWNLEFPQGSCAIQKSRRDPYV